MKKKDMNDNAREKSILKIEDMSKPVLTDLSKIEIKAHDLNDLEKFKPFSNVVIQVLLLHLEKLIKTMVDEDDSHFAKMLISLIRYAKNSYDGVLLTLLFEKCDEHSLRWAIGDTLAFSKPKNIRNWIKETLINNEFGDSREMLCIAAGKHLPKQEANILLCGIFDQFPGHAADGLSRSGSELELKFLKEKKSSSNGWIKREIEKAINKIEKRIVNQKSR